MFFYYYYYFFIFGTPGSERVAGVQATPNGNSSNNDTKQLRCSLKYPSFELLVILTCIIVLGLSFSVAKTSNISPAFVPTRIFSPDQKVLLTDNPSKKIALIFDSASQCNFNCYSQNRLLI